MENKEIRYAIIIGVNDYKSNPLNFCVNDAMGIKEALVNNCMFEEKNIFMIKSSEEGSEKDITGKYLEVLRKIKTTFVEEEDSILFYFAGHGSCIDEKSVIWLQESPYPIEEIFFNISLINPRVQTYIIDSCESGSKVLTRNKETELQKYLKSANGTMFLYACQNTESARELSSLEHGLLTYKVLEAINNKSMYDEKGYLTFNRIIDFVQREIPIESEFGQIPVIENSITGFYPFGIDHTKILISNHVEHTEMDIRENIDILKGIRYRLQDKCVEKLHDRLSKVSFEQYKEEYINNFDDLIYSGVSDLEEKIVRYVEENKLVPLNNLIYKSIQKKKYNHVLGNVMKSLDLMNNVPEEVEKNIINFDSDNLKSEFKLSLSSNINNASFGIGYILYQAKWGVVMLVIAFLIDWDGEDNNDIKNINIDDMAIALEEKSLEVIDKMGFDFNKYIGDLSIKWNEQRRKELDRYRNNLV